MDVAGSVALVTGANRGLGKCLCSALLARGAAKVYAGARDVSSVRMDGVEAIQLDITSPDDIAAAAAHCGDLTLLVNNAGIGTARRRCRPTPSRWPSRSSTRTCWVRSP